MCHTECDTEIECALIENELGFVTDLHFDQNPEEKCCGVNWKKTVISKLLNKIMQNIQRPFRKNLTVGNIISN